MNITIKYHIHYLQKGRPFVKLIQFENSNFMNLRISENSRILRIPKKFNDFIFAIFTERHIQSHSMIIKPWVYVTLYILCSLQCEYCSSLCAISAYDIDYIKHRSITKRKQLMLLTWRK